MKHGRSACATRSVPADKIETLIVDQIRCVGTDPVLQAETFRQVLAEVAAKLTARSVAASCATASMPPRCSG